MHALRAVTSGQVTKMAVRQFDLP